MSREMVLRNGMVEILEVQRISSMTQSQMLEQIYKEGAKEPTFISHGRYSCAMTIGRNNRTGFLMYLPPSQRRSIMYEDPENGGVKTVHLWLPHTYILVKFARGTYEGSFAYMAHKKITGPDSPLGYSPLPNVYRNGSVCNGDGVGAWSRELTPEENAQKYVNFFLGSRFSRDITDGFHNLPPEFRGTSMDLGPVMESWSAASLQRTRREALDLFSGIELRDTVRGVCDRLFGGN